MTSIAESKATAIKKPNFITRARQSVKAHNMFFKGLTTLILAAGAVVIMIPLVFMISTSLKDRNQLRASPPPLLPYETVMVEVNGKQEPLYTVNFEGAPVDMALIKNQPDGKGLFVFPDNPEETYSLTIADQELQRQIEIHPENYIEAMTSVPFPRYLLNTMIVTFVGMFGMLLSSSLVAYGFSRFRAPGLNTIGP